MSTVTILAVPERMERKTSGEQSGVLQDVLTELDRERSRRAELEAEIRTLKEDQQALAASVIKKIQDDKIRQNDAENEKRVDSSLVGTRELVAMETERDGYKELVHVLTADNDAISATMKNTTARTLPLHVVRMLEIMPYDQRAVKCAKANEEVYEWQVYKAGRWQGQSHYFPALFRKIPIVQPKPGAALEDATTRRLFPETPPKHCVLTNEGMTKVYKLDRGFTLLPHDGGDWEWISGWRVDKRVTTSSMDDSSGRPSMTPQQRLKSKVDCDDDGWSYAADPQHFVTAPAELCWSDADLSTDFGTTPIPQRPYRRRRWTRQRALKSYPHASEMTRNFLRLLSENARFAVMTTKLSDQLVETKMKLTEAENEMLSFKAESSRNADSLTRELKVREEMITTLVANGALIDGGDPSKRRGTEQQSSARLEKQFGKGLSVAGGLASSLVSSASTAASKAASNAFRKSSEDLSAEGDEPMSPTEHRSFDWKKIGRSLTTEGSKDLDGTVSSPSAVPALTESRTAFDWKKIGLSLAPSGKSLLQGLSSRKQEEVVAVFETQGSGDDEDEEEVVVEFSASGDDGKKKVKKKKKKKHSAKAKSSKADDSAAATPPSSPANGSSN